jgi:alpha-glucosidase
MAGLCLPAGVLVAETVSSPDGHIEVELGLNQGMPHWSVQYKNTVLLKSCRLGMDVEEPYAGGFEDIGVKMQTRDKTWEPVWGRFSEIRDHHREVVWQLQEREGNRRRLDVVVRAYDAGVAVRYRLHGSGSTMLVADQTHFHFAGDAICWSANGEHPNVGPVRLSEYDGYQFPLTVKISDGCYASILEAAIEDQAYLAPRRVGDTEFVTGFTTGGRMKAGAPQARSEVTLPARTSWRVLLLGASPGDLLTGNLLENLNPACVIEDTSWIRPGLAMWDWRAWGGTGKDGFVYNLDMASWRRMIDFAAKHGIAYLVLDANWYGHEFDPNSNPVKSRNYIVYQPDPTSANMADRPAPDPWDDPIDVPALITYGRERGVGVFLYINDVARKHYDFPGTLKTYRAWGAAGIKYGFMGGQGQEKVRVTRSIVKLCAENRLHCDFHDGPVPPSGDVRTYPNYLAREHCHAQADARRSFSPGTFCTTVFCNMLAGPLDMCNGFMTLTDLEKQRPKVFQPIHSTVVAEAARVMITFSGLAFLPDTPESYESKADLFEFIARLPMTWDETRILNGQIGRHITTARRSGDTWFVASCCDEDGAALPIACRFLKEGVEYRATLFEDTEETHYMSNKESYRIRKRTVHAGDVITARLAPGGGHCMIFDPVSK